MTGPTSSGISSSTASFSGWSPRRSLALAASLLAVAAGSCLSTDEKESAMISHPPEASRRRRALAA